MVPCTPRVQLLKVLVETEPIVINSEPIKIVSPATNPVALVKIIVVSELEIPPESFRVVVKAPSVVPPHNPAPQPVALTTVSSPVFIW